ncbi:TPA: hypothetical protein L9M28_000965 [Klebsiella quasipneumoniae subsp. quasipneumoniae]|nr:hypothetical protein [Klebsiella quasipneumoniae subsp. quasipneumoniae]
MELEKFSSEKIKITVDYYDDDHRNLLNSTSRYDQYFIDNMKKIISEGIEITGAEYLINSLVFKQHTNPEKYTQRNDLMSAISSATQYFIDDLEISNNSLRVPANSNPEAAIVMKRVGESIGLSVVSRIIGVNEADWSVIPELGVKAFDFRYAATTKGIVQVETKGTNSIDISKKNNNIYSHASSINDKKNEMSTNSKHPYPGDYNYGTIAFCPKGGNENLKCYLLDPPSGSSSERLAEAILVKKLGFYYRFMNFISPDSKLINLLHERTLAFADGKLNLNTAKKLDYSGISKSGDFDESFFLNKKTIKLNGLRVSGDWFHLKKNYIVFIGIKNSIINDIVLQSNEKLSRLKYETFSHNKELIFNIQTGYQKQQLKRLQEDNGNIYNSKVLKTKGNITLLASGVAIGILKVMD